MWPRFVQREFGDKDLICAKGEPGDTFYLISEGNVTVKAKGQEVAHLKSGDFFGERALIVDEPRQASTSPLPPPLCGFVLPAQLLLPPNAGTQER